MKYRIFLLLFAICYTSCNYFIASKKSQLGYQKRNDFVADSIQLRKFNTHTLSQLLKTSRKKYFIILHHNVHCTYVDRMNKDLLYQKIKIFDSIEILPVVHDYLYNFRQSIQSDFVNTQPIYYTDKKQFKKTINPNMGWKNEVLTFFKSSSRNDTSFYNFYFIDTTNGTKYVYFYNSEVESIEDLIFRSTLINYKLND